MSGFGKFYEQAFEGSMVGSGLAVFAVWGYVIAKARPPGVVELNPKLLASVLGGQVEEVKKAIQFLCSPDPESRGKEHEGRRLVHVDAFKYQVPRWSFYRGLRDEELKRDRMREYMREKRAATAPVRVKGNGGAPPPPNERSPGSAVWEAYFEAYRERWRAEPARSASESSLCSRFAAKMPAIEAPEVIRFYCRSPRELYVKAKHPLTLAVRDAQALRTEWVTQQHGTDTAARQGDQTAARFDAFKPLIEEAQRRERGGGQ